MTRLLEDLLDVARITQDKLIVERAPMDLLESVQGALREVQPRLQEKQLHLSLDLPPGPVRLLGDASRIQQAVGNLLSNAARYTPAQGRVRLSLTVDPSEALLRVQDSGIGMSAETLQRVFEPFFQGHAPGSRGRDSGMGIGLALVRRIAELHDGAVSASSRGEGSGSEFTLRFPLDDAPLLERPALPEPPTGLRLLLVEDDVHNRAGLTKLLEMDGLQVIAVGSGEDALQVFPATAPEAILLDIGLPGIDGHETCRRLRALPGGERVVILALTGFGQQSDRNATSAAGFSAHVVKPIVLDDLYLALNRALLNAGRPPAR
jgi:CheY-like chemotaxis protein/anti-sigma regulatory factor (Ser/Thr protein kinase)